MDQLDVTYQRAFTASPRYYHLVGCIAEFMLRSDEDNQHVHGGYAEETAPSSNLNDTDKYKSREIIVHNVTLHT